MNDRDLETRLRDAYRTEASQADPGALIERVHAIPTEAGRERPKWWQRLGSGATRSVGSGGIHVRGASNMFAATGVSAAIVALILSGAFLTVQVEPGPEAESQPAAVAGESWITVTGEQYLSCAGQTCLGSYSEMSDPRLKGDIRIIFSVQAEPENGPPEGNYANYALSGDVVVTNDGGTWEGSWIGFRDAEMLHHITAWLTGTGAYEGLVYLEQGHEPQLGVPNQLVTTGLLFEGDIPDTVVPPVVQAADPE